MQDQNYYGNEREDIIAFIPNDAKRILDVGCGFGFMAKKLKELNSDIEVAGIEKEGEVVNMARDNVDKLIVGDIENMDIPFEKGYFDCIVYGDVLEHLKSPWQVLKKHKYYLKNGGYCIVSIPNIAHYSIIKGLLRGKWEYKDSGIMDKTHLRFFTLSGIKNMMSDAGYTIVDEKRYIRASKSKKILNTILRGKIGYLLTEQYLIKGRAS